MSMILQGRPLMTTWPFLRRAEHWMLVVSTGSHYDDDLRCLAQINPPQHPATAATANRSTSHRSPPFPLLATRPSDSYANQHKLQFPMHRSKLTGRSSRHRRRWPRKSRGARRQTFLVISVLVSFPPFDGGHAGTAPSALRAVSPAVNAGTRPYMLDTHLMFFK